jgi:uncharacterized protein
LGIGEALVTMLNEKGIPTPLVHCMMAPPRSRMDILNETEISTIVSNSKLVKKYNEVIDSKSAYEILNEKLNAAAEKETEQKKEEQSAKEEKKTVGKEKGFFDNPAVKQVGRTAASVITRTLLGVLGLGGTTRRKKRGLFG